MSNQKSNPNDAHQASHQPVNVRQPSLMLSDLTDDLLWPRILRAPALALSPSRLITGSICAFLLSIVLSLASMVGPNGETEAGEANNQLQALGDLFQTSLAGIQSNLRSMDPIGLAQSIGFASVAIRTTVMESPMISLLIGLPLIAILAVVGGAISRSTAIEFAKGQYATSDDTLGFALRRTRQFVGAVVGPIVACVLIFLLIAIGGLLLSFPVLDVVGAILYPIALGLGILTTIILMLHILALPMIVPALAIEGTDGFDAIQRSYAYVIGKPLRYLTYTLILTLIGVLSIAVFTMVAQSAVELTNWAASLFASDSTNRVLTSDGEMGATKPIANNIINIWHTIIQLAVAGYAISLFFTSSTLLYLVTRRICDGQDINEVWDGVGE
ncbi:hypothetical protein COB72_04595 [bacterium]|nr:MAG: hypothetical protein COB72_04595 [bacterium]